MVITIPIFKTNEPIILWFELMVFDASNDGSSLLRIDGKDAADAMLVMV